ncbi:mitochondrial ATPase inhibitor, IATP-domain-containing protein [Zygosaccharomyces rouxii]|nr:mitochondrial ATPase inhibitor, IATP-domain-containing protein [Zygosaccharomyces rouxii]
MLSRSVVRTLRSPVTAIRMYSEAGSTGTTRGGTSDDTFTKREKASEDWFIKQHEKEQLEHLKKQISEQSKRIEHLENKQAVVK